MLIARAPLRISLAGGGTDLPSYYTRHGGLVVSATIDKYVYARVAPNESRGAQIVSADYQTSYLHGNGLPMNWDGDLALPRAVLHELGIHHGVSLFLASEVPPGTGLGSSSALAVALIGGIAGYVGRPLTRHEIAEMACKVELEKLGAPIGKQDQFAAAFGGLNAISFTECGVQVSPITIQPSVLDRLNGRLLLYFTGTARNSATILREQQEESGRESGKTVEGLHRIRRLADDCLKLLEHGDLDGIGELLHEGWLRKRELASGITSDQIDMLYEAARAHGAIGGKITGAGGGGFLLLCCHEGRQADVAAAMERQGLRRMDFRFEPNGVMVSSLRWQGTSDEPAARATA
jgi:D-glycero-alpha-D-manno-heptose-7-phosphate kinase